MVVRWGRAKAGSGDGSSGKVARRIQTRKGAKAGNSGDFETLNAPDRGVRISVTNGLKEIDPEAARMAGVE